MLDALQSIAVPLLVGVLWGITNSFIARGARLVATKPARRLTGLSPLDGLLHHLLTPAFAVPQALNVAGGVLFAASLRGASISLAAPVANGVSLAANAVADHLLGDRLRSPAGGALGVLLVCVGVTLCTLAQQPQDAQQAAQ